MEDIKKIEEQELNEIVGGQWGYNIIHDESMYTRYGIETDWSLNPFHKDGFWLKGERISDEQAAAIVFYCYANNKDSWTKGDRFIEYKREHMAEYEKFLKKVNS